MSVWFDGSQVPREKETELCSIGLEVSSSTSGLLESLGVGGRMNLRILGFIHAEFDASVLEPNLDTMRFHVQADGDITASLRRREAIRAELSLKNLNLIRCESLTMFQLREGSWVGR